VPIRRHPILLALGIAATTPAQAEPPRDSLHTGTAEIFAAPDERGMTLLRETRRRSPNGLLYPYPTAALAFAERAGWQTRGALSLGALFDGGDEDETRFERYVDRDDGVFLEGLNLELAQPERGDYSLVRAGSIGRDDAFYELTAGRAGLLRLRASHSGVPHRYASDAVALHDGVGGDTLALPAGLVAGASAEAQVAAALDARGEGRLEVQRDRTQTALRLRLRPDLALVGSYGLDARHGEIPSGVGFSFPELDAITGGMLEIAAPVDDRTHAFSGGVEWASERAQANLGYHGSLYRNRQHALSLEQPFAAPTENARLALAPDNAWHDVRADLGLALPLRGRLKSTVSWSTGRQDEDLLPPTINAGVVGGVDLAPWSSRAALSEDSASASVDHLLVDVDVYASPWRPLRLRAGFRHSDQDTDTDYTAWNPQTAEYGYIVEDGGHAQIGFPGFYQPAVPGSSWRYRSIPFGAARRTYELGATYSAPLRSSLDVRWQHEDVARDVSERRATRERRWEATLGTRGLPFATARLGFAYRTRDGGRVDYGAYAPYYTESLPGFLPTFPDGEPAHNLADMVRPDLADVRGQRWNARVAFALGERSDLVLSARLRSDDYGPDFGLVRERARDVAAEWSVQPSPALSAYVFLSADRHARAMGSIRGFATSSDGSAGGPNFPLANGWRVDFEGSGVGWGGGLTARLVRSIELDTHYAFLFSHDELETSAGGPAAPVNSTTVARRLPALRSRDHVVETALRIALRGDLSVRLFHRYERSAVDDYHQTGLPTLLPTPGAPRRVFFGHEDADFEVSVYGIAAQMRF
jgi:MtrB/PioB family decaheme-associated outer membrane protein